MAVGRGLRRDSLLERQKLRKAEENSVNSEFLKNLDNEPFCVCALALPMHRNAKFIMIIVIRILQKLSNESPITYFR